MRISQGFSGNMGIKEQSQKDHGEIFVRNKKTKEEFLREQGNTRDLTILGRQRDGQNKLNSFK
jgi:hypothetical protein